MVKLSPELIQGAGQYINPVKDYELDLRGYKIPLIENLGATLDQFDAIDFSDNELRKLDNFPLLARVKCLYFNNNRIVRVGENLDECLPSLHTLILTNNSIQELADIEQLSTLATLKMLSLLHNPVVAKPNYRPYVIHKFPALRVLDFKKVKAKERSAAKLLYKTKQGKDQLKEIQKRVKTFVPGQPLPGEQQPQQQQQQQAKKDTALNPAGLTPDQVRGIKTAIARASTLEEIERLNQMLRTGTMPAELRTPAPQRNGDQVVEMDED